MGITATKPRANAKQDIGNFWWADLQAKDLGTALDFYGRVLGWEFRAEDDGEGNVIYHTALIGGVKVAGAGAMQPQALASGMPSVWTDYVLVEDAQATCDRAAKLGGKVMMPPMEIFGEGTMAVVLDPTGAAFGLWQPGGHTGAEAVNQPSTLAWTELYSSDVAASVKFYSELFGWSASEMDGGDGYQLLNHKGRDIAGIMPKTADMGQMPDAWITYFGVADVAATKAEVEAAGGTVIWGPTKTGPGTSIGVSDPQGAVLHLIQLDEWPAD